ncbi:MAG: hypothetical protein HRS57_01670, partial [Mycoplasmataceae bacterium]|nr:hypothetical protein [Mycoplasmataceae bacterium]
YKSNFECIPSYVDENSYKDLVNTFKSISFKDKYNLTDEQNNLIVSNILIIVILSRYDFREDVDNKVINDKLINEHFSLLTKNLLMFLGNQKDANKIIVLFSKILSKLEKYKYESNW